MPLQQTSGAASYDAFGGGAPVAAKYIEDFFQSWLRTGTGSSTTVTTGLNASINKSLVWTKSRSAATNHKLTDTARGVTKALSSNTTGAEVTDSQGLTAFNSTGYTIGTNTDYNNSGATYVDGQLVATPKFFDVVTWTGDGVAGRDINHSLGSVPGCVIIKRTDSTSNWSVYHKDLRGGVAPFLSVLYLNTTAAQAADGAWMFDGPPTDTTLSLRGGVNAIGATYVAYLFAHNAGGFGLTGTDNVISCGSFTTNSSGVAVVDLGWEPQWVLVKPVSGESNMDWRVMDNMRGITVDNAAVLRPNSSAAEFTSGTFKYSINGFTSDGLVNSTQCIYIAIRRGPMKTPTSGTSVFAPIAQNAVNPTSTVTTNFPADMSISAQRTRTLDANTWVNDRLRGSSTTSTNWLQTSTTNAELNTVGFGYDNNTGYVDGFWGNTTSGAGAGGQAIIYWNFRRAPGFFDEVCYTGNGSTLVVPHNLGVAPELIITKTRSVATPWYVTSNYFPSGFFQTMMLNATNAVSGTTNIFNQQVGASTFTVESVGNNSGDTYVAYLFASCPGVSKVGTFTGTGTTQVINCGFTGGARFVLIKATSTTGNWLVWDSARGIVAGNDPYLALNSTAAEVTNTDWVDTAASGFELSNAGGNLANSNGVSYIFLAIA